MRPVRSVQLDFLDGSSLTDLVIYLGQYDITHAEQEIDSWHKRSSRTWELRSFRIGFNRWVDNPDDHGLAP